eukprot:UC4_evm1s145
MQSNQEKLQALIQSFNEMPKEMQRVRFQQLQALQQAVRPDTGSIDRNVLQANKAQIELARTRHALAALRAQAAASSAGSDILSKNIHTNQAGLQNKDESSFASPFRKDSASHADEDSWVRQEGLSELTSPLNEALASSGGLNPDVMTFTPGVGVGDFLSGETSSSMNIIPNASTWETPTLPENIAWNTDPASLLGGLLDENDDSNPNPGIWSSGG